MTPDPPALVDTHVKHKPHLHSSNPRLSLSLSSLASHHLMKSLNIVKGIYSIEEICHPERYIKTTPVNSSYSCPLLACGTKQSDPYTGEDSSPTLNHPLANNSQNTPPFPCADLTFNIVDPCHFHGLDHARL